METISRSDMKTITVDLFSGMGGFALAAHMMGWETAVLCEIDPNCQVVLVHHFPGAYIHGDIHTLTGDLIREKIKEKYGDEPVRIVLCGGFPCQPYSAAGKRKGVDDDRYLWPETVRIARELRPNSVVFENVFGLTSILEPSCYADMEGQAVVAIRESEVGLFDEPSKREKVEISFEVIQQRIMGRILQDIESAGLEAPKASDGSPIVLCIPACSVGAPHRRDRVWFVANAACNGSDRTSRQSGCEIGRQNGQLLEQPEQRSGVWPLTHPRLPESQGRDEVDEGQQHGGWRLAWSQLASFGGAWPFAYATGKGLEGCKWPINEGGRERSSEYVEDGDAPNTESCGIQRHRAKGQQVERTSTESGLLGRDDSRAIRDHWQNFPTEPPLRVGDDGISARLGRVCLPGTKRKLTESAVNKMGLKMAGNAVVPQVVFQIFKALEATW